MGREEGQKGECRQIEERTKGGKKEGREGGKSRKEMTREEKGKEKKMK